MSTEQNKAIFQRLVNQFWHEGNLAVADELVSPGYVYHEPGTPETRGVDGYKQLRKTYVTAFPDLRFTIDGQVAEGDKVVTRMTARGTHKGDLTGIAPTGKRVAIAATILSRFAGGKLVEDWETFDALGMLQQLGVVAQ